MGISSCPAVGVHPVRVFLEAFSKLRRHLFSAVKNVAGHRYLNHRFATERRWDL